VYTIYCHTNKNNGKRYVGYTKMGLETRWSYHLCSTDRGSNLLFHNAIRKHGIDAWHHDVICEIETLKDAKYLERHYIEMLHTWGPDGYNMTPGGDIKEYPIGRRFRKGHKPWNTGKKRGRTSEATKAKLSAALKGRPYKWRGKKLSEAHRAKMKGRKPWNTGLHWSEEMRRHLRETQLGKPSHCKLCGQAGHNKRNKVFHPSEVAT